MSLSGFIFIFSALSTAAYATRTNFTTERKKMLSLLRQPPAPRIRVENLKHATERNVRFTQFYVSEITPVLQRITTLKRGIQMLAIMRERSLMSSLNQKKEWSKLKEIIQRELLEIQESPEWRGALRKWANLGTGLKGELVTLARKWHKETKIGFASESEKAFIEKLSLLSDRILDISETNAPSGTERIRRTLEKSPFPPDQRKRTSSRSAKRSRPARIANYEAHGKRIATKGEKIFQQMATLRSELAKQKGFKNGSWTEYRLSLEGNYYAKQFQRASSLKKLLLDFLRKTESLYDTLVFSAFPAVTSYTPGPINSTATQTEKYFPAKKARAFWRKTMIESGFDPSLTKNINIDMNLQKRPPRSLMCPVSSPSPEEVIINAVDLSIRGQWNGTKLKGGEMFIILDFFGDGVETYRDLFHEGGHALEASLREDITVHGASHAYSETHSGIMEHFLRDPIFLKEALPRMRGKTHSGELLEAFLRDQKILQFLRMRNVAADALFDLMLWDYDYSTGEERFVDRALRLYREIMNDLLLSDLYGIGSNITGYELFTTDHFYSGRVRYFAYFLGELAAISSVEKLLDILESSTGRRTFYNQPELASILTEGLFKSGFLKPFPKAVEDFTGHPLNPNTAIDKLSRDLKGVIRSRSCRDLFR